jgi:hypothetical protein
MAQELSLAGSASYEDAFGVTAEIDIPSLTVTLSTKKVLHTKQTVGITEEALVLGDITTPCLLVLVNRDETNYVSVKVATSGAIFAKLNPDNVYWCIVPLGSGAQAPFVIANSAECELEIFLCAL